MMKNFPMTGFSRGDIDEMDREFEEAAKKLDSSSNRRPKLKLKNGKNILMWLPSTDAKKRMPYRHLLLHFNPRHICMRDEPRENSDGQIRIDGRFSNCPRCLEAWERFSDEFPKDTTVIENLKPAERERRDFLKNNLASQQMLIQVVNVTPFFKIVKVGRKENIVPDVDMIDNHYEDFIAVMNGEEPSRPLPKALQEAAETGVSLLYVSNNKGQGNGGLVSQAFFDRFSELKDNDPLLDPSSNLLVLNLSDSGKKMKESTVYHWDVSFTDASIKDDGWKVTKELSEVVLKQAVNIHSLPIDNPDQVMSKAAALHRLTDAELKQLYTETNWTLSKPGELSPQEEIEIMKSIVADAPAKPKAMRAQSTFDTEEEMIVSPSQMKGKSLFNKLKEATPTQSYIDNDDDEYDDSTPDF